MATIGGINIVTNGLILCLDAANQKSYISESTAWRDISSNNNNGTLTNGPTFSSINGGSIVFDGVDDYVNFSSFNTQNQITCESWFKVDTSNITGSFVAGWLMGIEGEFRLIYSTIGITWVCKGSAGWYSPGTVVSFNNVSSINNIWFHAVGTYNGAYNSIYVNGLLIQTGSNIAGAVAGGSFFIGKGVSNVASQKGNGSIYRIYNRALSAVEVLQNYEALKSRYIY